MTKRIHRPGKLGYQEIPNVVKKIKVEKRASFRRIVFRNKPDFQKFKNNNKKQNNQ